MKCEEVMLLLSSLDDLPQSPRFEDMKLHIDGCESCRAEYTGLLQLDRAAKQYFAGAQLPAGMESRIFTAVQNASLASDQDLSHVENTKETLSMTPTQHEKLALWRISWLPRFAVAACILVAGLMIFLHPSVRQIAFADVVSALDGVHTAHWTMAVTRYDDAGKKLPSETFGFWARLDSPAALSHQTLSGPLIHAVQTEDIVTIYDESEKTLHTMKVPTDLPDSGVSGLIKNMITLQDPGTVEMLIPGGKGVRHEIFKTDPAPAWSSTRGELRGKPVVEFTRTFASPDSGKQNTMYVDVDPATKLIVRSMFQTEQDGKLVSEVVNDGFAYNTQPPAGVFEQNVPAGTTTVEEQPKIIEKKIIRHGSENDAAPSS